MPNLFHIFKGPGLVTTTCLVGLFMPLVSGARAETLGGASAQAGTVDTSATTSRGVFNKPSDNLARIDATLHLSDAQKAAILPVLQKLQDELSTLQQSGAGRGSDDAQTFVNTAMIQVRAQLTAAQGQVFDTIRATRRSEMFHF